MDEVFADHVVSHPLIRNSEPLILDLIRAVDDLFITVTEYPARRRRDYVGRIALAVLVRQRLGRLLRQTEAVNERMERIEELTQLRAQAGGRAVGCEAIEIVLPKILAPPEAVDSHIGSRLKALRDSLGIDQGEMADRIGVHRSNLSRWELYHRPPTLANLSKILAAFPDLSSDWLLTGRGEAFSKPAQAGVSDGEGPDLDDHRRDRDERPHRSCRKEGTSGRSGGEQEVAQSQVDTIVEQLRCDAPEFVVGWEKDARRKLAEERDADLRADARAWRRRFLARGEKLPAGDSEIAV